MNALPRGLPMPVTLSYPAVVRSDESMSSVRRLSVVPFDALTPFTKSRRTAARRVGDGRTSR